MTRAEPNDGGPHERHDTAPTETPSAGSVATQTGRPVRRLVKRLVLVLHVALAAVPAASSWLEAHTNGGDSAFLFWGQLLALAPGLPGKYLRKCYYYWTL